jgi:hypothetical protein
MCHSSHDQNKNVGKSYYDSNDLNQQDLKKDPNQEIA